MPGVCPGGGGMLKFRIDRRISVVRIYVVARLARQWIKRTRNEMKCWVYVTYVVVRLARLARQ